MPPGDDTIKLRLEFSALKAELIGAITSELNDLRTAYVSTQQATRSGLGIGAGAAAATVQVRQLTAATKQLQAVSSNLDAAFGIGKVEEIARARKELELSQAILRARLGLAQEESRVRSRSSIPRSNPGNDTSLGLGAQLGGGPSALNRALRRITSAGEQARQAVASVARATELTATASAALNTQIERRIRLRRTDATIRTDSVDPTGGRLSAQLAASELAALQATGNRLAAQIGAGSRTGVLRGTPERQAQALRQRELRAEQAAEAAGVAATRSLQARLLRSQRAAQAADAAGVAANRSLQARLLLSQRAASRAALIATRNTDQYNAALKRLTPGFLQANSAGVRFNGILSTISRTLVSVGSLVAFGTALRGIFAGVALGDQFEGAEAAIAGLIASTGRFIDVQGDVLKPSEALAESIKLSRDQVRLLQKDAERTSATFSDLLNAFQSAVGPGLAVGLDLDTIRELTLGISQVASAINLPQNQLPQEVRSLFTGDINERDARIAQVLQISSDDIKGLINAADLADFLRDRLEGVVAASVLLDSTFSRTFSNLGDVLSRIGAQAFDPLRQALVTISLALQQALGSGALTPLLTSIGQGLGNATLAVARFVGSIDPAQLTAFGDLIGQISTAFATAFIPVLSAAIAVLGQLNGAATAIAGVLGSLGGPNTAGGVLLLAFSIRLAVRAFRVLAGGARLANAQLISTGTAGGFAAVGVSRLALAGRVLTRSFLPLLALSLLAELAFSAFGGSAESAIDPLADAAATMAEAADELERIRAGSGVAAIFSPIANGAEQIAEAFQTATDDLKKFREELDGLRADVGRSSSIQGFNQAVRELIPRPDLSQIRDQREGLFQASDRAQAVAALAVGAPGNQDSALARQGLANVIKAASAAVIRLSDNTQQLNAELAKIDAGNISAITAAAERTATEISGTLPDLSRQAELEEQILAAKRTESDADDDLIAAARLRLDLARLQAAFDLDVGSITEQRDIAAASTDAGAPAAVNAIDSLLRARVAEFNLASRALNAQVTGANLDAATKASRESATQRERAARASEREASAQARIRESSRDTRASQDQLNTLRTTREDSPLRRASEFTDQRAALVRQRNAELAIAINPLTNRDDRAQAYARQLALLVQILGLEEGRVVATREFRNNITASRRELQAVRERNAAGATGRDGSVAQTRALIQADIDNTTRQIIEEQELNATREQGTRAYIDGLRRIEELKGNREGLGRELSRNPNTFGGGARQAAEQFTNQNGAGQIGNQLATGSINATTTLLSDSLFIAVANAFNPEQNQSLGESIRGLLLSFGASLLRTLTDALADAAVSSFLKRLLPAAAGAAAGAAGGSVQATAEGGIIGPANTPGPIRGAPASDRTLVAATAGEFMFTKGASRRIGYGKLAALMRGEINLPDFDQPRRELRIRGYAEGGVVGAPPARPIARSRGGSSRGGAQPIQVLPVLVAGTGNVKTMLRNRGLDEALRGRITLLRAIGGQDR